MTSGSRRTVPAVPGSTTVPGTTWWPPRRRRDDPLGRRHPGRDQRRDHVGQQLQRVLAGRGGPLTFWPGAGRTDLVGSVDAVAVYPTQLTADTIAAHRRAALPNQAPTAAFTATTTDLSAALDAGASADADGRVVSWSWDLGDGKHRRPARRSAHAYAAPGTYRVTLTVTDDRGAVGTTSQDVVVTRPAVWVLASDGFARTTTGAWGRRTPAAPGRRPAARPGSRWAGAPRPSASPPRANSRLPTWATCPPPRPTSPPRSP